MHDDRLLFEFLILEGAQAGLSWLTILKKRENYRRAFARFDPEKVARCARRKVERWLTDSGMVRNRLKVESAVSNARAFLAVRDEFGSFDAYQWRFVDGRPVRNRFRTLGEIPPRTAVSDAFSKDLKKRESFRRIDDRVRAHAGDRDGQRSSRRVFPAPRSRGNEMRTTGIVSLLLR